LPNLRMVTTPTDYAFSGRKRLSSDDISGMGEASRKKKKGTIKRYGVTRERKKRVLARKPGAICTWW